MSQATQEIPNSSGYNFRQAVISVAKSLASMYSGTVDPTTLTGFTSANQFWLDMTNNLIKQLNTAGTTWKTKGTLDSDGTIVWYPTFLNNSFSGDFHSQTTQGTFVTSAIAQTNAPNATDLFWLYVVVNGTNILHFAVSISSGQIYTEYYNGTSWSSNWYSPLTTASLLATNITNTAENLVTATNVQNAILQLSQASYIANTATGGITTTNVQASLTQLDNLKAPIANPVFTGTPQAVTASKFSTGTQLATLDFANSMIGNHSGVVTYTGATTLTAADCGKLIICNSASAFTLTTPSTLDSKMELHIVNIGAGTVTLASGSGSFYAGSGVVSSPTISQYGMVNYACDGTNWYYTGGSNGSGIVSYSFGTSGYVRYANGYAHQWITINAAGTTTTFGAWPLTFTEVDTGSATNNSGTGAASSISTLGTSGAVIYNASGVTQAVFVNGWGKI